MTFRVVMSVSFSPTCRAVVSSIGTSSGSISLRSLCARARGKVPSAGEKEHATRHNDRRQSDGDLCHHVTQARLELVEARQAPPPRLHLAINLQDPVVGGGWDHRRRQSSVVHFPRSDAVRSRRARPEASLPVRARTHRMRRTVTLTLLPIFVTFPALLRMSPLVPCGGKEGGGFQAVMCQHEVKRRLCRRVMHVRNRDTQRSSKRAVPQASPGCLPL